eukprot:TRINITY_DN19891_c2_g1_i2.p1 TRINITY_DN19891_c2_g1~~TRINITY_DN19891_c2_g1_i2.p1  ORF type:complete len:436 (-),score=69.49 TRINITY_DN19891_c2_g1_i2:305-1612(-)
MSSLTMCYLEQLGIPIAAAERSELARSEANHAMPPGQAASFTSVLQDACQSALTKYDSLEAQFAGGKLVKDISDTLVEELSADSDLRPFLVSSEEQATMQSYVRKMVGLSYGEWKKSSPGQAKAKEAKKSRELPLPWASIDAYPEWVMNQIDLYVQAELEDQDAARRKLEQALLENLVVSASIKYDGTCFGKLSSGELCGRREVLGELYGEYQRTSTASSSSCDVEALRLSLMEMLTAEIGQVCVWGELMCNPNFYNYKERGLADRWVCFGAAVTFTNPKTSVSEQLQKHGLSHSFNSDGSKARLFLCPALRRLLHEVGAGDVAEDQFHSVTQADVVEKGAAQLRDGQNEGIVLVFERANGQASLRKWKNSAEGAEARKQEARLLRQCYVTCKSLADQGKLDGRIADMVDTLRSVAEAETSPMKKGRDKVKTGTH